MRGMRLPIKKASQVQAQQKNKENGPIVLEMALVRFFFPQLFDLDIKGAHACVYLSIKRRGLETTKSILGHSIVCLYGVEHSGLCHVAAIF